MGKGRNCEECIHCDDCVESDDGSVKADNCGEFTDSDYEVDYPDEDVQEIHWNEMSYNKYNQTSWDVNPSKDVLKEW